MMWSALELAAIKEYAARCVTAERERCAKICFGMVHECSSTGWNACAEMSAAEILEKPNTTDDRPQVRSI